MQTMLDRILAWMGGRAPDPSSAPARASGAFRMLVSDVGTAVDSLVGDWSEAPTLLPVHSGDTVSLRVDVGPDLDVRWSGAREVAATLGSSTACPRRLREPGRHAVRAEILDSHGRRLCALDTVVDVRR